MGAGITDNYPGGSGMKNKPVKESYADEFFRLTVISNISKASHEHYNQPEKIRQRLFKALRAWNEHARTILVKYGYDKNKYVHIPKQLGGVFCFERGANAYDVIKEREAQRAYEVITKVSEVYILLRQDDKHALAWAAIALGSAVMNASLPEFETKLGRKAGEKARKGRQDKLWTKARLVALKKEIKNHMDKFDNKTALYMDIAERIAWIKDRKKYRQIETQAMKLLPEFPEFENWLKVKKAERIARQK